MDERLRFVARLLEGEKVAPLCVEFGMFPSHLGDSTARWEGDTLVVDVISFNGEGWLASGQDKPAIGSTGV